MLRTILFPLLLSLAIWVGWSWFDYRAADQAMAELIQADTFVRLESLRGNIDKHRQGAVLLARHPVVVSLSEGVNVGADYSRDLPKLVSMTDIDGASILTMSGHEILSFPARSYDNLPARILQLPGWNRAKAGSLGKHWTPQRYYFFAPVFRHGSVVAVAVSHFSMDEAYSQLVLSQHAIRILNFKKEVLFDNNEGQWDKPRLGFQLNDLDVSIQVIAQGQARLYQWAGGSSIAALVALGLSSLIVFLLNRRRRMAIDLRRRVEENQRLEDRVLERTSALVRAQDTVVKSGKLALLGQITASIAHEINQPLGAIQNYAQNSIGLIDSGQLDIVRENQEKMAEQARRSARILENLRAFSRPDQLGVRPVQLSCCIENVVDALSDRFPAIGGVIKVELGENLTALVGQVRLEQVLMNLVVNAWYEVGALDEPQIIIGAEGGVDKVSLYVEDNGTGIDFELSHSVFEPFMSTRKDIDGLGLGLAIAKQFIESMNGSLTLAQPVLLGGARFEILLEADTEENKRRLSV